MFEIGFPELVILAVVGLLVLGPERLPKAARFLGLWVRRARAQWYSVKSEFERELAAEELRKSLQDSREAMRGFETSVRGAGDDMQRGYAQLQDAGRVAAATQAPDTPPPVTAEPADAPRAADSSAATGDGDDAR